MGDPGERAGAAANCVELLVVAHQDHLRMPDVAQFGQLLQVERIGHARLVDDHDAVFGDGEVPLLRLQAGQSLPDAFPLAVPADHVPGVEP